MKRCLLVFALLVSVLFAEEPAAPTKFGSAAIGQPLPEFTVTGADGNELKLADFRGKTVILNFWRTNRGPADALQEAANMYGDQNTVVLAVCSGATQKEFENWVAKTKGKVSYNLATDKAGDERQLPLATRLLGINSFPATCVVSKDGKLVGGFIGTSPAMTAVLRDHLRTAGLPIPADPKPELAARPDRPPSNTLKAGEAAPDFATLTLAGKPMNLSDYKGKIVVLDFWATWCGPCIASMPHTQEVAAATKAKDVVVLASGTSDTRDKFEAWLQANGAKFPDLVFSYDPAERGPERASAKLYKVDGIPTQFVIGRDGVITDVIVGYGKGDTRLEDALKRLGVNAELAAH